MDEATKRRRKLAAVVHLLGWPRHWIEETEGHTEAQLNKMWRRSLIAYVTHSVGFDRAGSYGPATVLASIQVAHRLSFLLEWPIAVSGQELDGFETLNSLPTFEDPVRVVRSHAEWVSRAVEYAARQIRGAEHRLRE